MELRWGGDCIISCWEIEQKRRESRQARHRVIDNHKPITSALPTRYTLADMQNTLLSHYEIEASTSAHVLTLPPSKQVQTNR